MLHFCTGSTAVVSAFFATQPALAQNARKKPRSIILASRSIVSHYDAVAAIEAEPLFMFQLRRKARPMSLEHE
jgi:hypothetical protein